MYLAVAAVFVNLSCGIFAHSCEKDAYNSLRSLAKEMSTNGFSVDSVVETFFLSDSAMVIDFSSDVQQKLPINSLLSSLQQKPGFQFSFNNFKTLNSKKGIGCEELSVRGVLQVAGLAGGSALAKSELPLKIELAQTLDAGGSKTHKISSIQLLEEPNKVKTHDSSKNLRAKLQEIILSKDQEALLKYKRELNEYCEPHTQVVIKDGQKTLQMNVNELASYLKIVRPKSLTLNSSKLLHYTGSADNPELHVYEEVTAFRKGLPHPNKFRNIPTSNKVNLIAHQPGWFFEEFSITLNY